jgi:hypothetical protein
MNYVCNEANHNKDYSVVKTFKPPRLPIRGFFIRNAFFIVLPRTRLSVISNSIRSQRLIQDDFKMTLVSEENNFDRYSLMGGYEQDITF